MGELVTLFSFIGASICAICGITGAYIWGRWGMAGCRAIWSIRHTLDVEVSSAVRDAVKVVRE